MPRDCAGWAQSTSAEQKLGCGVYKTLGRDCKAATPPAMPAACLGSVPLPSRRGIACRAPAQHTALLGQAGQGGDSSDHKGLGEAVAQQEGGGSSQEDKDKAAARLKHKDAEQHQEPA